MERYSNTLCRKCQYATGYGAYNDRDEFVYRDADGHGNDYSGNYGVDADTELSCLLDCEQFGYPSGCDSFTKRVPGNE